jgi:hypothetical protein
VRAWESHGFSGRSYPHRPVHITSASGPASATAAGGERATPVSLQPHITDADLLAVVDETHEVYDIDADDLRDLFERLLEARSARAEVQARPLGTRPEAAPSAACIAARDGALSIARSANTPMLPASLRSEPYGLLGTARPSQPRIQALSSYQVGCEELCSPTCGE